MKFITLLFFLLTSLFSQAQDSLTVVPPSALVHPYHKHSFSVGCGTFITGGIMSDGSKGYYMLGAEPRLSYFFKDFTSVNATYFQTKLQTFGLDTAYVWRRATGSVFVRRYMGDKKRFFADLSFTSGKLYAHTTYEQPVTTYAYKIGYGIGGSWVIHKYLGALNNRIAFEIYVRKHISLIKKKYKGDSMLTRDVNMVAFHYYFTRPSSSSK